MERHKKNPVEQNDLVSKSQRKRDAHELKKLALKLMALDNKRLSRIPLDEDIREAIEEARDIRSNVARKRQMQYAAKLLRRVDATEIFETLESFENSARKVTVQQHRCEAWRDFLIESGDDALGLLLKDQREVNIQTIRQLTRNARLEASKNRPPSSSRSLFRLLRDMDEEKALPAVQA